MKDIRPTIACIALTATIQVGCSDAPHGPGLGETETDADTETETHADTSIDTEEGGDETGPPDEPVSTTFVRFDLGPAPLRLAAVPFPSELYRDEDGRIAIGSLPNPRSDDPVLEATRELLALRDGFCSTCNAVFAIEGGLDVD